MAKSGWGPFLDCLMSAAFPEQGIGYVVFARRKGSAAVRVVAFVVDSYCLGVKNCLYQKCSEMELRDTKEDFDSASKLVAVDPSYAKKFLEGVVAYAQSLGFGPHPDFQRCFHAFDDVDSSECKEEFSFGKDGKPFYVQGPQDLPAKAMSIVNTLHDKLGADGYHYVVVADGM